MPFVDIKVTKKLTDSQRDALKAGIGACMALIGKPESYTMVGIIDGYTLYFAGRKLDDGAHVAVDVLGSANPEGTGKFTGKICEIFENQLEIPGKNVYIEYRHTPDWGWNGSNF